ARRNAHPHDLGLALHLDANALEQTFAQGALGALDGKGASPREQAIELAAAVEALLARRPQRARQRLDQQFGGGVLRVHAPLVVRGKPPFAASTITGRTVQEQVNRPNPPPSSPLSQVGELGASAPGWARKVSRIRSWPSASSAACSRPVSCTWATTS